MNENLNLVEILKDCPKGTKLYSIIFGDVKFNHVENDTYPIVLDVRRGFTFRVLQDGRYINDFNGECTLFPSKEQRDWSKFTAPWYKKERFDPKTLRPFDKVLVKDDGDWIWRVDIISVPADYNDNIPYLIGDNDFDWIIPYNEETKHLVGTTKEAPEYYRYWED